jgi:hypothetical protein
MKKLLFILTALFILTTGMNGCGEEEKGETAIRLDNIFTIKIDETVNLLENNDSILSVHFKRIINDGRCPKSQCELCYGSRADIQISIIKNGETSDVELSIWGCIDEEPENSAAYKDTLGYRLRLLRLDPYPNAPNSSGYKAKLKITKL